MQVPCAARAPCRSGSLGIGITYSSPFPAEVKNEVEMLDSAVSYRQLLSLPASTIIMFSLRNHSPAWGHPGAIKCGNLYFGAKMGPTKELKKAIKSQADIVITI
jgi:hypothetical protein